MAFVCTCKLIFKHRTSLRRHIKAEHPAPQTPTTSLLKCSVCSTKFQTKREFIEHVSSSHDLPVRVESLIFESIDEFHLWKTKEEHETCSYYRKARSAQRNKNDCSQRMAFVCTRSGYYSPRGKGIRHLKTQGSNKLGGYCPSEIKLKVESDGKCCVHYVKTHWGHKQELAHIHLTADERAAIANKIAAKVPLSDILYGIRRSVSNPSEIQRLELVTRKDLHNIASCFNLNSEYMKHANDAVSVDAWVKELQEEHSILFYKPQGSACEEYPVLSNDDFFLAFMNDVQASMLERYGGDIVCIDGTHGLNAYHFELVTLMVVDDLKEGFPCAFLFTSRTDKDALAILFSKIRERLEGRMPRPKVFMSDMADSFFNAWVEAMESPPEKRLYCAWHVDRAWQKQLNKIQSKFGEKKASVYKMIRALMEEVDEHCFEENLPLALERMLDDPDTQAFGEYFLQNYAQKAHLWAYCYRLRCGVNTNMYVESFHKCLKYYELERKKIKRLDRAILAILKFLHYKTFDRIITLHKGKITSKLRTLRLRHKTSLGLNTDQVIENGDKWSVASSNGKQMYTVSLHQENCSCQLFCAECDSCIHRYVCTCPDSLVSCNMCKHVHLVLSKILQMKKSTLNIQQTAACNEDLPLSIVDEDLPLTIVDDADRRSTEKENLLMQVCSSQNNKTNALAAVKSTLLTSLNKVTVAVENSESIEGMVAVQKLVDSLLPTLSAVGESCGATTNAFKLRDITNKRKIDPQQRHFSFYSCKKSKTSASNRLSKPDSTEKNLIMLQLSLGEKKSVYTPESLVK